MSKKIQVGHIYESEEGHIVHIKYYDEITKKYFAVVSGNDVLMADIYNEKGKSSYLSQFDLKL